MATPQYQLHDLLMGPNPLVENPCYGAIPLCDPLGIKTNAPYNSNNSHNKYSDCI